MKFSLAKEPLQFALGFLNSIVDAKPTVPILANILVDVDKRKNTVRLAANNGESTLIIQLSATVSSGGVVAIPAQKFKDVISAMPFGVDKVEFDLDEATYTLSYSAKKVRGTLRGMRGDAFPSTEVKEFPDITTTVASLYDAIAHVIIAADKPKSSRPELQGIFFLPDGGKFELVAGDGTRLAVENIDCAPQGSTPEGAIVPARVFKTIRAILKEQAADALVEITFPDDDYHKITFAVSSAGSATDGAVTFTTQVINEQFPDIYSRISVDFAIQLRIPVSEVMAASAQVVPFVRDNGFSVTLTVPGGEGWQDCTFSGESQDGDGAGSSFKAHITGHDIELNFNVDYLIHALRVLGIEFVNLWMNGDTQALVMTPCYDVSLDKDKYPGDEGVFDYSYIFMPLSRGRVIAKQYAPDPEHADQTVPYYLQGEV